MDRPKIGITSECVCDLAQQTLKEHHIDVIPLHIITDTGRFRDLTEITSDNILDYMADGRKAMSVEPSVKEFIAFFTKKLEKYEHIIHISMTSKMSNSYNNATKAIGDMKDKVTLIDSRNLSTGMAHLILKASQMAEKGESVQTIETTILAMRERICTSFIAYSADYLYFNGRLSKTKATLCRFFKFHPVLTVKKDGQMALGGFYLGNYEEAAKHYIAKELKHVKNIERDRLYITYAGCGTKLLNLVRKETERFDPADEIIYTTASATVSSNCGPFAFGLLFVNKEK